MMRSKLKRDNALLLAVGFVIFAIFIVSVITLSDFGFLNSIKAGKLAGFTPGKTTAEDVEDKLGKPESVDQVGDLIKHKYSTKSEDYKDTINIEGGVVASTQENIFDDAYGFLTDYVEKYGEPDLILYDKSDENIKWNIFLDQGLGVATFLNESNIAKILEFIPQEKTAFLENVAEKNGLISEYPREIYSLPDY